MTRRLAAFWRDEGAMTVVEYALLLALVAVASVAAWGLFGESVGNLAAGSQSKITP
jgi:Flp pilus assembly pilin Flp